MANIGDLHKVWEIKALKKPGEDEARKILERIAKQVQPIMRKHNWRVKLLSEFCPNNPSLLGLNVGGGVQVKLRLRKPNRDWDFYPYDQVLDTMLHELCHNAHSPHNASFYKLWDEIRKECEDLMNKGITGTGEGFDLPGRRLGGFSRQPPLSSLRQTALSAAEKRSRLNSLLPSGPKRLGGDSGIMGALSPVQAAAMAAERRFQDDLWCGGVSGEEEIRSGLPPNVASMGPCAESSKNSASTSGSKLNHGEGNSIEGGSCWECETCTLLNPELAPLCEACGNQRPKEAGTKFKIWSCKFCTLENNVKLDKCSACDQWRYSYGAPVATSGLNLGT